MRIVLMCPKCGLLRFVDENDHSCDICEYCNTNAIRVIANEAEFDRATPDEMLVLRERVCRKYLYSNQQYDEETYEQRLQDDKKEDEELERKFASIPPSNTPKCPYCNSLYVEKITTGGRLISTVLFGLGSSKVGKQWHCKQCGSNF